MAGIANLQINIDARGAIQKLREFTQGSRSAAAATAEISRGTDAAAEALGREGRHLLVTANGLKYFIDVTGRARAENGRFLSATEKVSAGIRDQGKAAESTGGKMGMLAGVLGRVAIAAAAIQAARFVIAKTSELETQTRSLETLTGSAERAAQIISELQQLGAVTPFTSTELIDAAKRLQAFGVEAKNVVETTRRLADVSGATGAELQGLVTAYGQVQAKGRLQGEELLQFQERGISLQKELQKMYGMTGEEFQKALSKGQVSAKAVEVAIIRLTSAGGKYANGAIAQSTTLAGKFSTLTDGIESIAKKIGTVLSPALKGVLDLANAAVDAINRAMAGPDRKKTNEELYNTRARIAEIKGLIAQEQAIGGGRLTASRRVVLQQLEAKAKQLQSRLSSFGNSGEKQVTQIPVVPPLLGDQTNKGRQRSMDDLIGGKIKNALELQQVQLRINKAAQLNFIQMEKLGSEEKASVETLHEFYNLQLEINALQTTQTERAKYYDFLVGQSKDKEGTKLMLARAQEDIAAEILRKQSEQNLVLEQYKGTLVDIAQKEQEKNGKIIEQGQTKLQQLMDERDLLQARIAGNEAEVMLKQQLRDLTKEMTPEQQKQAQEVLNAVSALKGQLAVATEIQSLYNDIGSSIKNGVVGAIQGAIDGTKTLGDVANTLLSNIANKLLDVAVNMALFGSMSGTGTGGGLLGFLQPKKPPIPARAMGGPVTAGQPYLVGERGPELFVPSGGGKVLPSGKGGGNVTVNVSVDATGSQVAGDNEQASQLGRAIAAAVQSELIKAKRPGGILNS